MSAEGSSASVVRDALGREGALGGPSGESESFYLREKLCDRSSIACISFTEFLFKNILEDLQIIQLFAKIKLSFRRISLDETYRCCLLSELVCRGAWCRATVPKILLN